MSAPALSRPILDRPPQRFAAPQLSTEALSSLTAELAASAASYDHSGELPWEGLWAAHRAGAFTATIAPQFGGPGLSPLQTARLLVALGEGDPSVALIVANSLAIHALQGTHPHWPVDYYERLLELSAQGPAPVNAIRAEPELGAPARGGIPATTLTRTPNGWRLDGQKAYATGGAALAFHVVWATVVEPDGDAAAPRVGHVVVPADLPGIEWIPTWDHLGLRASNTHDVRYTGVELPYEAFSEIPRGADGVYRDPAAAGSVSGAGSFGHPALYVGVARAARNDFAQIARTRVPAALGRPIAQTERIQAVAGEIELQIAQAEALLYGTLLRLGANDPVIDADLSGQASVIKAAIARSVIAATQTAVAAVGNLGLTRHNPLERHLRDALCIRVHPPQEDAALIAAGVRILTA